MAKLVGTVPDFTSRGDAAKTKYTDLLAVMSQAQATYCGSAATCTVEEHLKAIKTMLEGTPGANGLQTAITAATAAWNNNSHNSSGVKCNMMGNQLTCTTGLASTGTLDITVTGSGAAANLPFPVVTFNNVPKPATQAEFCSSATTEEINSKFKGLGGTVKISNCTFTGSEGTVTVQVDLTAPVPIAYAFTVSYKYH
jgi:hypothetical protein